MADTTVKIVDIQVNYNDAIKGIAEYQKRIASLRSEEKNLDKTQKDYGERVASIKEQIKGYTKEVNALSKQVQTQIKLENEETGSLNSLRAELSKCTAQYDKLSRAERESAKGKELQKHINDVTTELKKAEEETQRYYRNVGNYKNSIIGALTGNNQFAQSFMQMASSTSSMQGMMASMGSSIKAFGASLMSLMANPVFLAIAGIAGAGMAFKWFYDYNKGIAEATRLTKEFTGQTGTELQHTRDEIMALSDAMGKDFKDTLSTVDSLMAQYGISSEEAISIVKDGFVSGADLSGNMLDQMKQYAPAFHDIGINAEELTALISQTRSGIFSEDGMNAIQMAGKKIREMSSNTASDLDALGLNSKQIQEDLNNGNITMFEVIQQVSQKLGELNPQSQLVGQTLSDVFGRQGAGAGYELVTALQDVSTNLDEVKEQTGTYGEAQEALIDSQTELNDATADLFDITGSGFEEMELGAKTMVNKGLTAILRGIKDIVNWFKNMYNGSVAVRAGVQSIAVNFKVAWNAVKLFFNLFIDGVKSAGRSLESLAKILEGVVTFSWDKVKEGFNGIMNNFGSTLKEQFSDIKDFAVDTANVYADAFNETLNGKLDISSDDNFKGENPAKDVTTTTDKPHKPSSGRSSSGRSSSGSGRNGRGGSNSNDVKKQQQVLLEAQRRYNQEMLKLIGNGYDARRRMIEYKYQQEIDKIREKMADATPEAKKYMEATISLLNKQRERELDKLSKENMIKEIKNQEDVIKAKLEAVKKGSDEELALKKEQLQKQYEQNKLSLDNQEAEELIGIEATSEKAQEIRDRYAEKRKGAEAKLQADITTLDEQAEQKRLETIQQIRDNEIQRMQNEYDEKLAMRKDYSNELVDIVSNEQKAIMQKEIEGAEASLKAIQERGKLSTQTEAQYDAEILQAKADVIAKKKALNDAELTNEKAKTSTMKSLTSSLIGLTEEIGESNKAMAKASKVLALAQVAIDTGVAIAEGLKSSSGVPYPANLVAIGTTIATVMANITTALSTIRSAKFAKGAVGIRGKGTATSDSIPAMISNGESVINAKATSMFAPLLLAINSIGNGTPIGTAFDNVQREGRLVNAYKEALKDVHPVVAVTDINEGQNRVKVIENLDTL